MTQHAVGDRGPRIPVRGGPADPAARVVVPGVQILEELGRGAHTVVYRARRGESDYAVKVLATPGDEREVTEFRREAALLACVRHPGLVRVHEVGEAAGRPYLIMDLVDGRSLADVLSDGPLPEARVIEWASAAAAALGQAHRAGLVHRDVKPENLMIGSTGQLRLIDFGLAARSGSRADNVAVGTFTYSAPEQTGVLHRAVDGRSDLYALGVVLFECLTGQPPFAAPDAGELIWMHLSAPPPELTSVRPDVSPAVSAVVAKLLAKDPDDRYQTADGLHADLDRIQAGQLTAFALGAGEAASATLDTVLVGREAETASLDARWARAHAGAGGAVLVQGAPGAGKSRLVQELTTAVAAAGHPVFYGRCESDDATPLAVVRGVVQRHVESLHRLAEPARTEGIARLRAAAGDTASVLQVLSPALGELLDAPDLPAGGHERQLVEAVSALLVRLAEAGGGAVLHLDDVQWCDDGSRVVLRRLSTLLPDAPLLLVMTAADDGPTAVESFAAILGPALDLRLPVGPLDEAAITALIGSQIGSSAVPQDLVTRLATRSGGNPMAVLEYTRAVVDAGLLRPSWGSWLLDEAGLEALALPDDILDLVLRRIDGLGAGTRELLTVAATVGLRFSAELVAAVAGTEPAAAHGVLAEVAGHRLIEATDDGGYLFPHERIRETILVHLDDDLRRDLHRRVAEHLDRGGPGGAERVYQVARHYLLGGTAHDPQRVFRAAAAAGALALTQQAPAGALEFLLQAESAAALAGLRPGPGFHTDLAVAAHRLGDYDLGREHLNRALDDETDPMRRCELHRLVADVHLLRYEGDQAIESVRRGLAEAGHPLPRNPLLLTVTTLALFGWGVVLGWLPQRWRALPAATAQRYRLRLSLSGTGGEAATMAQRMPLMAALLMRNLPLARRLGPGREALLNQGGLAFLAGATGRRRHCERNMEQAIAAATAMGDLNLTGLLHYFRGVVRDMLPPMSATSGAFLEELLADRGRWLDVGLHLTVAATLEQMHLVRGHARTAAECHRRVLARVQGDDEVVRHMFAAVGAQIAALSGQPADAARQLRTVRDVLATMPDNQVLRTKVAVAAVHLAVEQGEVGEVFETALAEFRALRITPAKAWNIDRIFWVYQAFGRLAQVTAATAAERGRRLASAAEAVAELRRAANGPVLRAYAELAGAALAQLGGDHTTALRRLAPLDGHPDGLDLPLLNFDIARVRARAYEGLGRQADARWQARVALLLATEQGWLTRIRWVRAEFVLPDSGSERRSAMAVGTRSRPASNMGTMGAGLAGGGVNQRRLQSLQQVALAAATALDPGQVARLVLDEIVAVFAAERAFLFLRGSAAGAADDDLAPYLGRDDAGTDLTTITGYGSTLVDRVRDTGEPLVVTGGEEGAALGSQSTVIHGLRSIMVAPLMLKGSLMGVIYLDSRAAKGIFTADDVDILAAITHHVATSLETARAAQLELGMHAARRERDLAQLLHHAMIELGASLDPAQVGQRLIDMIAGALPVDAAVLLQRGDNDTLIVGAVVGGATSAPGATVSTSHEPSLIAHLAATEAVSPAVGSAPPGLLGPGIAEWLAVPLTVRGEQRGLVVAGTAADRPYTQAEAEIAAALAGQGAVALENAVLFRQVEELATRDGLTGLFNRRHFFESAQHRLATSRRYQRPLAAIMIDIDHFKRVNDTHGHPVGDDVIREVANRLAATLRETDIICRYGGEEFAVLLPETPPADAEVAAGRLHRAVSATPIPTQIGPLPITVSVGVAGPQEDHDVDVLLQHADEALYAAKRAGRDRVAVHHATIR